MIDRYGGEVIERSDREENGRKEVRVRVRKIRK